MCRSIHQLHNYQPPATEQEIREAAVQYVRKISGMTRPARVNQAAFDSAVDAVTAATAELLGSLVPLAPSHDREVDRRRARLRWERREMGRPTQTAG